MDKSTSSAYAGVNPDQTPQMPAYVEKESPIGITADTLDIFLVAAAKDGDHQAYAELCRRYSKQILRTILRITHNVADAEDTLQETLLKAYVHIGTFEGRSAFSSWLTRIAINSALMLSRKKHSRCEYSLEGGVDGDDFKLPEPTETANNPEEACIVNALENECIRAIRYLSPNVRVVVQIRYREDASIAQISKMLGISEAAVKTRLLRARSKIRAHLEKTKHLPCGIDLKALGGCSRSVGFVEAGAARARDIPFFASLMTSAALKPRQFSSKKRVTPCNRMEEERPYDYKKCLQSRRHK
jgi:RNA polymerase sigma factor (sigma-70 family)